MTDLLTQLGLAAHSLSAHRAASATASHNIENASTPGYARQRAELAALLPAAVVGGSFIGRGVELMGVSQARDAFVEHQLPAALGSAAFSAAEADAVTSLATLDPDDAHGLPASFASFYAALRELQRAPGDPSLRASAVDASARLATAVRRSAEEVASARGAIDRQLGDATSRVNSLAADVARLNRSVREARAGGDAPNDLLDARQRALDELVGLTGGAPLVDGDGNVNVSVGSAALVAGDRSATLALQADPANDGHQAVVVQPLDGAPARTLATRELHGRIGGLLAGRDAGLGATAAALDALAIDFAASLNAVHSAGVALDGSTGRALFVLPAAGRAARGLAIDAALVADPDLLALGNSAAPGDGAALQALIATERTPMASGADPVSAISSLIGDVGLKGQRALAARDADRVVLDHLSALRESTSGVSIDEELVEMTKAARTFEAIGKVIKTADEMLQGLLNLK